ncbi:cadherin-like domain-containing protein [Vibrio splendidus]|uniref:cadherin-like domain-containing protein n=1 Tax=Vibrio splendidus TaxID=29497 RepID=UPI0015E768FB|nr:cadherin-like domain-containing protein [Vibrio splendidus]UOE85918.1 cadherin-like domain-containing protein [Vibrio splendidus]UOE88644.1 cadherin-like domain-containing protein [Vibrio splendidus]
MKRLSLLASTIALILSGCGSDSSDNSPQTPPSSSFEINSTASTTATEDIQYQYQLSTNHSESVAYSATNIPAGMTLSSNGLLTWTPLEDILTSGEITVKAVALSEANLSDTQTFTITVTPVNDTPVAETPLQLNTNEDVALTISHATLLSNVTDVDSSILTITNLSIDNPAITITENSDSITLTALQDYNGSANLSFNVSDEEFTISNSGIVLISAVNDPVQVESFASLSVEAGESLSFQVQVTDPDDENNGSDIQFSLINAPSGLSVSETGELAISSSVFASTTHDDIVLKIQDGLEDGAINAQNTFKLTELFYYEVQGEVSSYYENTTIEDSIVKISNNGSVLAEGNTDASGKYSIKVLDTDLDTSRAIVVSADAVGFSEASESKQFSDISTAINLYLPTIHANVSFDSQVASDLQVDNETLVSVEAQSFVNAHGEAVTGQISSELFVIDPSLDIDLMPGEMITETPSGETVPIESFGAITATFTDSEGNELQLANSKTAQVRIPASGSNPPATIPLFYYDEVQGIWVKEGTATLENGFYVGEVAHFTTWNADRVYETIFINGCVVDKENQPIANARIRSEGVDYNGSSSAYSDAQGNFRIPVRQNSRVLISAESQYQSRTETINTGSPNMYECLTLDDATTKIQLTWGQSPGDLDTHFYGPNGEDGRFHVYYSNKNFIQSGNNIFLDVDDTSSYGPEIVTIPDFTIPGTYRYGVYNFSRTGDIQRRETKVEVILDGIRTVFTPPEGDAELWWHVFEIEVNDNLSYNLVPINQWSTTDPDSVTTPTPAARSSRQILESSQSKQSYAEKMLESKYYAD